MSTFERVRRVVAETLRISEEEVSLNANLVDDLPTDSMGHLEIAMALEEEFDIEISDEEIAEWVTIQGVVAHIEEKLCGRGR